MSEELDPKLVRKSRQNLVILWIIFLIPPVGAWLMYHYGGDLVPRATVNKGELYSPARHLELPPMLDENGKPVPADHFAHLWTLTYVGTSRCDDACQAQLVIMRQVRTAQNQHMGRVGALYLSVDGEAPADFDKWRESFSALRLGRTEQRAVVLDQFRVKGEDDAQVMGRIHVVDPLGNLMMRYRIDQDPSDIRIDIKKLLKVSAVR
ncbi:MAG: SCO family protein [Gammaproteobacteria bacterium]